MIPNLTWWWSSCYGNLWKVEYLFIAITPSLSLMPLNKINQKIKISYHLSLSVTFWVGPLDSIQCLHCLLFGQHWCVYLKVSMGEGQLWVHHYFSSFKLLLYQYYCIAGGARGVMVIVAGYGHGDTSSIPVQDWLHFT